MKMEDKKDKEIILTYIMKNIKSLNDLHWLKSEIDRIHTDKLIEAKFNQALRNISAYRKLSESERK